MAYSARFTQSLRDVVSSWVLSSLDKLLAMRRLIHVMVKLLTRFGSRRMILNEKDRLMHVTDSRLLETK